VKGSARIISIIERVVKSLAGVPSCDRWIVPAAGTIAPVAARALGATACPSAAAASSSRFGEDVADGKVQSRRVEPERPLARDPRLDDLARAAVVNDRAQDQVDDEVMLDAGDGEVARELPPVSSPFVPGETTSATIIGFGTSIASPGRRSPQ